MNTGTQNSISTIASTSAMRHAWAALRARPVKRVDYLGDRIAENELTVAKRSFQRMTARLHQRLAQGESTTRLVSYVKNWLRWANAGVVLNKERLVKTIKNILQNTLGFHQASVLLPD